MEGYNYSISLASKQLRINEHDHCETLIQSLVSQILRVNCEQKGHDSMPLFILKLLN